MKRIWLAVAVGLAATAGGARADFGGPPVMPPTMGGPEAYGPSADDGCKYGLHPIFRKCLWWKKDAGGCGKGGACGPKAGGYGMGYAPVPGVGYPGTPGAQMPGTLVFPNHPFNRGPRDYFMWEPGR